MSSNCDAYFLKQAFANLMAFAKDDKTPPETRELVFLMNAATARLLLRLEDIESQLEYWRGQAR